MSDLYNENNPVPNGGSENPPRDGDLLNGQIQNENLQNGAAHNGAAWNEQPQTAVPQNPVQRQTYAGQTQDRYYGRAGYGNPYGGTAQNGTGSGGSYSYTWGAQSGSGYGSAPADYNGKTKKKKRVSGTAVAIIVLLSLVLLACVVLGGVLYKVVKELRAETPATVSAGENGQEERGSEGKDELEPATIIRSQSQPREFLDGTVAAAVTKAYDSVVVITTETIEYDTFYGQYINGGAGSGVIISENGYIMTCAHVIDGANTVTVTTTDGTKYEAKIIGYDEQTDIGVVKIDAKGLSCAVMGDSDKITIGETAIAIGNPLGTLGGTVTSGIISALDREIEIDGTLYNLLQTSAEINPGNSGGGLFNIDGELIGVVNAKSSGSGVEGLGFAIPVNRSIDIAEQLINNGYIKGRPAIGVTVVEVSEYSDLYTIRQKYPKLLNYITDYGVYILEWKSGDFEFGDRIIAINDVQVSSFSALKGALAEYKVGDTVKVTVSRLNKNGQSRMTEVEVTLTESVPENISQ